MTQQKDLQIARCFNALSHPRRAGIFRLLMETPAAGQSYQTLVVQTGFAPSALTHHLRVMEQSGLIKRKRKGPFVAYFLTAASLANTIRDVLDICQTHTYLHQKAA